MNRLCLPRLQAIQSDHDVFGLPERGLVELFWLRTFKVAPVKEIGHELSFQFFDVKLTQCRTKCPTLWSAVARHRFWYLRPRYFNGVTKAVPGHRTPKRANIGFPNARNATRHETLSRSVF